MLFAFGVYDVTRGVIDYTAPSSDAGTLAGSIPICDDADTDADLLVTDIVRMTAVGSMETGFGTFVAASYRVFRWWRGRVFNPLGITVMLGLDVIGSVFKILAIADRAGGQALWTITGRGIASTMALLFTLYAHRAWWRAALSNTPYESVNLVQ